MWPRIGLRWPSAGAWKGALSDLEDPRSILRLPSVSPRGLSVDLREPCVEPGGHCTPRDRCQNASASVIYGTPAGRIEANFALHWYIYVLLVPVRTSLPSLNFTLISNLSNYVRFHQPHWSEVKWCLSSFSFSTTLALAPRLYHRGRA